MTWADRTHPAEVTGLAIDEALLESHRSYSDPVLSISERFVSLDLDTGRTTGVLSSPLATAQSPGWVLCHSFGIEQTDLLVAHAAIARRLAAAGYPVLRFQCQGYGESEHPDFPADVSSQVADTIGAVRWITEAGGAPRVGVIGTRFGAIVAALTADRLEMADLVLVDPVVDGGRYMSGLLRAVVMTEMVVVGGRPTITVEDLKAELESTGQLDIRGFALRRSAYEANAAVDLLKDIRSFSERCLLIPVSRSARVGRPVEALRKCFSELGASITVTPVAHPEAALFGQNHIRPVRMDVGLDQNAGFDVLADLYPAVASAILDWSGGSADPAPAPGRMTR